MREIKFRGLKRFSREWIYGMPTYDFNYIFDESNVNSPDNYEIDSDTVGQFTGLKDKNGKEIYEGDLIRMELKKPKEGTIINTVVSFNDGMFVYDPNEAKQIKNPDGWEQPHNFINSSRFRKIYRLGSPYSNLKQA